LSESVSSVPPLRHKHVIRSSTSATSDLSGFTSSSSSTQSSADIMELLHHHRCRALKRVPKASRLSAAEKLAEVLRQIVADPDCVEEWLHLLTFSFSCFGIQGQYGGKRHLSSLASKVKAATAKFSAVSTTPVQQQKVFKSRPPSDNIAARVSAKLEDGDIRGAV
jgi:hypothetical protein